ncbi:aminotransferase class I/II-fold pyridoxal phosphate-dependent enzyme [Candidatus Vidania fulgoroideorum]
MEFPYNFGKNFIKYLIKYKNRIYLNKYPKKKDYMELEKNFKFFFNTKKRIIFGNGSDEIIFYLIICLLNKRKGSVCSFFPTFNIYEKYSLILRFTFVRIKTYKNIYFSVKKINNIIKKNFCKIFFICFPNNPTGLLYKKKKIIKIIKNNKKTFFIIDEAYFNYCNISFLDEKFNNIIILRTLSKIGFASMRLGVMISNYKIYKKLIKKRPLYPLNIFQILLLKFIIKKIIKKKITQLINRTNNEIKKIKENLKKILYNSYGNFFFIRIKNFRIFKKLFFKKIIVKQLFFKDKKFIRFSVSKKKINKKILRCIKNEK